MSSCHKKVLVNQCYATSVALAIGWRVQFSYAVEVKKLAFYDKSHAAAHRQLADYMDRLGAREGWMVVFDPDYDKPWDAKIAYEDLPFDGRTIHLVRC